MPLLCTLVIGWLQWHAVIEMVNGRIIGRQLRSGQVALGVFRYSLSDAESCQFRYILTHDPEDLALYGKLIDQTAAQFTQLRQLTAGNDLQQKNLDLIEPLLKTKEAAADQSFALEQKGDHAGAMQIITSDSSRQIMLNIEKVLEDMQSVQVQLILQRQYAYSATLKMTAAASVAGLAINLACIAAILLFMRRLQHLQSAVTLDALRELVNYEDGKLSIEEYLSRRAAALSVHGHAQIEAEKLLSQIERRKSHRATQRVPTTPAPPR